LARVGDAFLLYPSLTKGEEGKGREKREKVREGRRGRR
jgi:hypothetical protein